MTWDQRTETFIDPDPPRGEFPIEREDLGGPDDVEDAARGLVLGVMLGIALWATGILAWRSPGFRTALEGVALVMVVVVAFWLVLLAGHSMIERWRDDYPDSRLFDWLRRSGL